MEWIRIIITLMHSLITSVDHALRPRPKVRATHECAMRSRAPRDRSKLIGTEMMAQRWHSRQHVVVSRVEPRKPRWARCFNRRRRRRGGRLHRRRGRQHPKRRRPYRRQCKWRTRRLAADGERLARSAGGCEGGADSSRGVRQSRASRRACWSCRRCRTRSSLCVGCRGA